MEIIAKLDSAEIVQGVSKKNGNKYTAIRVKIGEEYTGMIFLSKWEYMYIQNELGIED